MAHRQTTARPRETGSRVPSKIVDKNTGKCYRTGKMLGKVRADGTRWLADLLPPSSAASAAATAATCLLR